jgi:hypothetical protein
MWQTYPEYCADMKRLGTEPLPEEIWQREYAPKDEPYREPLIITPKKPVVKDCLTTEKDHIADIGKTIKPKKKYAPRISRKGWTTEQIKARRSENVQNCKARKKLNPVTL